MSRPNQYATYSSLAHPKEKEEKTHNCVLVQDLSHRRGIISDNKIVCIDWFADWCGPCKSIAPKFEVMAEKYNKSGLCALIKEDIDKRLERKQRLVEKFWAHGGEYEITQNLNVKMSMVRL